MDVRIIVETTAEMGSKRTHELCRLCLSGQGHGDLVLKLEDTKDLLGRRQREVLNVRIEDVSHANRRCPNCNRTRRVHDYRTRVLDTLFGRFRVKTLRLRKCSCSTEECSSFPPFAQVFPDRATPELQGYRPSWVRAIRSAKRPRSWRPSYPAQNHTTPPCVIDWAGSQKKSQDRSRWKTTPQLRIP